MEHSFETFEEDSASTGNLGGEPSAKSLQNKVKKNTSLKEKEMKTNSPNESLPPQPNSIHTEAHTQQ